MLMAYAKLHQSLVTSSLWSESDAVRIMFITLLALADKNGEVQGSLPGLVRVANLDAKEGIDAIAKLLAPDEFSTDLQRAPEHEGRRIEQIPGGFRVLNYEYYRGLRDEDDRRRQNREAQRRYRSKQKSASVSQDKPESAHTEAEADTEAEAEAGKKSGANAPSSVSGYLATFERWWKAYPRKAGSKADAHRVWQRMTPDQRTAAFAGIEAQSVPGGQLDVQSRRKDDGSSTVPHATTWLRGRRWEADVEVQKPQSKTDKYHDVLKSWGEKHAGDDARPAKGRVVDAE